MLILLTELALSGALSFCSHLTCLVFLIIDIVILWFFLAEQNQDGFRRTGMLDKVVPAMTNRDPAVRLYAAEALVNLTLSAKNQEVSTFIPAARCSETDRQTNRPTNQQVIAKANAQMLAMRGLTSTNEDNQFRLQCILLLYNLSHCGWEFPSPLFSLP